MSPLICMATYNGASFLRTQLDSIVSQSLEPSKILISDDGSTDGTRELIADFAMQEPRAIVLPPRGSRLNGACGNFEYLMTHAQQICNDEAHFIALADQDDVWVESKLEAMCTALGGSIGCYSDLSLIGASGEWLGESLLGQLKAPVQTTVSTLLAQNHVPGCALAFSPEVLALAMPFPKGLINHDWWLAMCACLLGTLRRIEEPLVQYRQHAGNVVGAYRPMTQLGQVHKALSRQRQVLASQLEAVRELTQRVAKLDAQLAATLADYQQGLESDAPWERAMSMFGGRFAAPLPALRLLRTMAVMKPLV